MEKKEKDINPKLENNRNDTKSDLEQNHSNGGVGWNSEQKSSSLKWSKDLPKAPVPDLEQTLTRYLDGLKAVISSEQFEETKKTAENFLYDPQQGKRLQTLLIDYSQQTDNWTTDFWLDHMYLSNPLSLVINSSPFFLLPNQTFRTKSDQFRFAASIVRFALEFDRKIESEELSQDTIGNVKLCMQTYRHFFNANRIPGVAKDHLRIVSKKANHSKHFIVAAFNQFNVVQLESNRNLPSIDELQQCFCDCWNRSRENDFSNQIGILTTENRRVWSRLRSKLLQDNQNRSNINLLEDSLFVLCLDDSVRKSIESINGLTAAGSGGSDVNLLAKMSSLLVHGGGSLLHTSNRWFDKFLQIVVSSDGLCGIVVEHSASEGMTVLRFCEEFLQYHRSKMNESNVSLFECDKSEKVVQSPRNTYDLNRNLIGKDDSMRLSYRILKWNLDQMILNQIKEAKQVIDRSIANLDLFILKFMGFGKDFIKAQHISPDVFVQLSLQLTFYKIHHHIVSTYESCSLRKFRLGRVDNIRASSSDASEWARSMCGPQIESNASFSTSNGLGPDNHLMALKELAKKNNIYSKENFPKLFQDESYKEYLNFRLSTSQLFSNEEILVGYGAVVPDGYGCSYSPKNNCIIFCITSFLNCEKTNSKNFAQHLEGSLLEMREICLQINSQI
ncbi:Choline O-acetyltransferase [Sarcoptes scabiei]|uniref:Choline O-acetyltransferase n=1 Tax=Sarcoptes scabiei TaxID=52283 RepID=A0A834VD35_SARSC|nr:Choline O-acetyltransferase [Sarcoptes scabiei]